MALSLLPLARIAFEPLADHTQHVDDRGHLVVAEAVEEHQETGPLGAARPNAPRTFLAGFKIRY